METFLFWFGALHAAAYAVSGFLVASALFIEWLFKRLRIKREVLLAYNEYLKRKHAKDFTGA